MEHRLGEVLEESIQVRADLGYPIMVTPFSQFVGSQAAINVIVGERYKEVTDQVIQYVLGLWGEEAGSEVDANVKDKVLSRPRAKEYNHWEPPEPSTEEIRDKLGGPGLSDDELLLLYIVGKDDVMAMRKAGPPKEYVNPNQPLIELVEELTKRKDCRQISIRRPRLSLTLEKRAKS
jgi:oxaloacetate decarboxylase alpha subunit